MKKNTFKCLINVAHYGLLGAAVGCSSFATRKTQVETALEEESRGLTAAVVDTLQLQPKGERDYHTETALMFAKQDQRVEGLPLHPFDVVALLGTNEPAKAKAQANIDTRFADQNQLLARQKEISDKLVALGSAAEREQGEKSRRRARWIALVAVPLTGIAALCFFFPICIPILGRILGWLVGKLPGLASAVGVVGVKAFDALVQGIETTRNQKNKFSAAAPAVLKSQSILSNEDSRRSGSDEMEQAWTHLELNLSRAMDAEHKRLVRLRKMKMGH